MAARAADGDAALDHGVEAVAAAVGQDIARRLVEAPVPDQGLGLAMDPEERGRTLRLGLRPGAAYELLAQLAAAEVNLLAFNAVPLGPVERGTGRNQRSDGVCRPRARRRGLRGTAPGPVRLPPVE